MEKSTVKKLRKSFRWKLAAGILVSAPILALLLFGVILFLLIKTAPDASYTETAGFLFLALWGYVVRIGVPLLLIYLLIVGAVFVYGTHACTF